VLSIRGIHKAFGGVAALDGLDLTVGAGEVAGLIGHNGAGKSTLAAVAAGLVRADAGTVTVAGADVAREPRRARARLGLAPQALALHPSATLREHLELFGALAGMRRRAVAAETAELVAALALDGLLDRRVALLSGGQQRRVQAACALLHRPPVLVLDEPTAGADPLTRDALLATVRARADAGATVLYATHYLPELEPLDATVAVLARGRVVARGDRRAILREPLEALYAGAGDVR
jgi:ABC-2 type transport system ATP-binding protein